MALGRGLLVGAALMVAIVACRRHDANAERTNAEPAPQRGVVKPDADPAASEAPKRKPFRQALPLLGTWCLQFQAMSLDGEKTLDGSSSWEFRGNGSYVYWHKSHKQEGTWKQEGHTLSIGDFGDHDVIELSYERMVLHRMSYQFFGRDCGPEYAKAELVVPLVRAADLGSIDMMEKALQNGADVNGLDQLSLVEQTALMAAARRGRTEAVDFLLRHGARYDIVSRTGETAMSLAERTNHSEVMARLSRAGAPRTSALQQLQGLTDESSPRPANAQPSQSAALDHWNDDDQDDQQDDENVDTADDSDDRPPRSTISDADRELADRFLDDLKTRDREYTQQRMHEIEERLPERPGMSDEERKDLDRQRIKAFLNE